MDKSGIIYIMTTSVKGLIKIGKTDDFKKQMLDLEQNGYWNVSGLHPFYAVHVKDCDAKEKLMHTIFSKSQVADSELFALDKDIAKQMLKSFDGEQVYPEVQQSQTVASEPNSEKRHKLTFGMLGIPVDSELIYTHNPDIKIRTIDLDSTVEYQGRNYEMQALVKHLIDHGSWQNSTVFTYQGETFANMRDRLGL